MPPSARYLYVQAVHVGVAADSRPSAPLEEVTSSIFSPGSLESLECRAGEAALAVVEGEDLLTGRPLLDQQGLLAVS